MPALTGNVISRSLLFAQFSARPWRIAPQVALEEMRSFAASPVFDELLYNLAYGEEQEGAPAGAIEHPLVIGWGRRDRVCLPSQSKLALEKFPDAQLHWFDHCGHFPQWDRPLEAVRLILDGTSREKTPGTIHTSAKGKKAPSGSLRPDMDGLVKQLIAEPEHR